MLKLLNFTRKDIVECGHKNSKVTDSRPAKGYIRRRRECKDCGERYSTVEIITTGRSVQAVPNAIRNSVRNELLAEIKHLFS